MSEEGGVDETGCKGWVGSEAGEADRAGWSRGISEDVGLPGMVNEVISGPKIDGDEPIQSQKARDLVE